MGRAILERVREWLKPQKQELKDTFSALISSTMGPTLVDAFKWQYHCPLGPGQDVWHYLDKKTAKLSDRHRNLRLGMHAFPLLFLIYCIFNLFQEFSLNLMIEQILVTIASIATIWIMWRLTLRTGRELATRINDAFEEPLIANPEHPGVIYGTWVKERRSLIKAILMSPFSWLLPKR